MNVFSSIVLHSVDWIICSLGILLPALLSLQFFTLTHHKHSRKHTRVEKFPPLPAQLSFQEGKKRTCTSMGILSSAPPRGWVGQIWEVPNPVDVGLFSKRRRVRGIKSKGVLCICVTRIGSGTTTTTITVMCGKVSFRTSVGKVGGARGKKWKLKHFNQSPLQGEEKSNAHRSVEVLAEMVSSSCPTFSQWFRASAIFWVIFSWEAWPDHHHFHGLWKIASIQCTNDHDRFPGVTPRLFPQLDRGRFVLTHVTFIYLALSLWGCCSWGMKLNWAEQCK